MVRAPKMLAVLFAAAVAALDGSTALVPPSTERAIADITADQIRVDVNALAADSMAGRGVGHSGNEQAVQYIAEAFRRAAVTPAAGKFLHPVDLCQPTLGGEARFAVTAGDQPVANVTIGTSFYPLPESAATAVAGRLIFAGHGISAPRYRHDDYANVKADGAIVLVLDGAPESLRERRGVRDDEKIALGALERKIADAKSHGAKGLVIIRAYAGDARMVWPEKPTSRSATYRSQRALDTSIVVAVMTEQAALSIRRALDGGAQLAATLDPGLRVQRIRAHNVLGTVEPAGALTENVIVGAHLDHDGVDETGQVFNGADDNASGTAAVLAVAAALTRGAADGPRPRRRIIFALWNAEEKGSLGAEAYLTDASVPGRTIANINLDMIGRGDHTDAVHLLGYTYSPDFASLAKRANAATRLKIKAEYDRDAEGLLQRSDHWPFLKRSIPALFFTTGLHAEYHTPDDDVERLDFAKIERVAELVSRLAWMVAEGDPPRFRNR